MNSAKKSPSSPIPRAGYTVSEIARAFGMSESAVRVWLRKGVIASMLVGGTRFVPAAEYERLRQGRPA